MRGEGEREGERCDSVYLVQSHRPPLPSLALPHSANSFEILIVFQIHQSLLVLCLFPPFPSSSPLWHTMYLPQSAIDLSISNACCCYSLSLCLSLSLTFPSLFVCLPQFHVVSIETDNKLLLSIILIPYVYQPVIQPCLATPPQLKSNNSAAHTP